MSVPTQPAGYHSVTPYLICKNAASAIEYYTQVFSAAVVELLKRPDGRVMHAELKIGDSIIMLADEAPEMGALSPHSIGGTPISLLLYVPDVDSTFAKAIAFGATEERPLATQFYGDRTGGILDAWGHKWHLATHVEDVAPEEMQRRMQSASAASS